MIIQEECMLVRLKQGEWSARRYDKQVSQEVDTKYNTLHAGNYNKILIALEPLKVIRTQSNCARTFH